jgi:exopolysaccharide production protein ExoZ
MEDRSFMPNAQASDRLRLNSVHAIRALAALLVATLHILSRENLEPDSILPHWLEYARIGTDLFFVMSGAVMVYATSARTHNAGQAVSFLYDRLTRVFPVYWIATTAALALWLLSGKHILANLIGKPEFWSTAFLIPNGHIPALLVAWTLSHLMFFYLMFSLILTAPKRLMPYILGAWALAVLLMRLAGWQHADAHPFLRFLSHQASWEFIAGVLLMHAAMRGRTLPPLLLFGAGAAWLLTCMTLAGPNPDLQLFYNGDLRFLEVGVPAMLFAGGAIFLDVRHKRTLAKPIRFLADISFGVYLMHIIALAFVGRVWSMLASPGPIDNIIAVAAMYGLSILMGWLLHVYVENPVRDFTKAMKPKVFGFFHAPRSFTASKPQTAPDDTLP